MEHQDIYNLLLETFGDETILDYVVTGGEEEAEQRDPFILVKTESLPEVCRFLRDDERTAFDMLHCISGVDWPDYMESVYHLYSMKHCHWGILKARAPKISPAIPSVTPIWPAADWHEREAYDLMGIVYEGHPDLRRILLPEEWEGHPLRKDYVMPEHERLRELGL
ncbi:MAG: NADH-quinone oxidoreductase subunit C [Candidatus Omnitrophica bacterium]|nr:NADH-quinone oxidoreductase subunit C [Candidatus Omnitrophota bacterium]